MDHDRTYRLQMIRKYMTENCLDTALIQVMEDIYWLTGFNTPGAPRCQSLIVTLDDFLIHSRKLEITNAASDIPVSGYSDNEDPVEHLLNCIPHATNIGIQYNNERCIPIDQDRIGRGLINAGSNLVSISDVIKEMRVEKSDHEIALMRRAGEICNISMKAAIKAVREPYASEKSIAAAAIYAAMNEGGDHTAYPAFVAIGKNGMKGHYACNDIHTAVKEDQNILIELAGCFQRYHVAMMRTVHTARQFSQTLVTAELYVVRALKAMRSAATPGSTHETVKAAARKVLSPLSKQGWILAERTCYNIGIGFAVDWGEVNNNPGVTLHENTTLHILPWIRHHEHGTVGISDTILVKNGGAISLLPQDKIKEEITIALPPTPHLSIIKLVRAVFPKIKKTPLREIHIEGTTVLVKDESSRLKQNSFKSLGGGYALACEIMKRYTRPPSPLELLRRLTGQEILVFATASDGNHGAGVAWAAKELGHTAKVWFPNIVEQSRIDTAKALGADVIVSKVCYDDTVALVAEESKKNGWCLVQDTSWNGYTEVPNNIMDAYSLIIHEVVEQITSSPPTHIILQVGVGSFAAGIVRYVRSSSQLRNTTIITVESEQSACLFKSLTEGVKMDVPTPSTSTLAAGLDCCIVSDLAWKILRDEVDFAATVSEEAIAEGLRLIHSRDIMSGESGAAVGAGFLLAIGNKKSDIGITETSKILIFNTEGVTAPETTKRILGEGEEEKSNITCNVMKCK